MPSSIIILNQLSCCLIWADLTARKTASLLLNLLLIIFQLKLIAKWHFWTTVSGKVPLTLSINPTGKFFFAKMSDFTLKRKAPWRIKTAKRLNVNPKQSNYSDNHCPDWAMFMSMTLSDPPIEPIAVSSASPTNIEWQVF
jgi:hypothetical protein